MPNTYNIRIACLVFAVIVLCGCHGHPTNYYLRISGDDRNGGDRLHPWRSLNRLSTARFHPGDTVFLQSGETFSGNLLLDSSVTGTVSDPIVFCSAAAIPAVINSGDEGGLALYGGSYVSFANLILRGSGRKSGNTKNGMLMSHTHHIVCDNLDISGYQKSGLAVVNSRYVGLSRICAHDNGYAGITALGEKNKTDCEHIVVKYSRAMNNPGDPTELNNHSGNGILAGYCSDVLIDHCVAGNNGWDMPRVGNGPVGIWCFEADHVMIQYCTSFENKTAPGAADGGGFDLDGGTTNSVIQHCLSYQNQGSGYGIFQYSGASDWNNNIVRFCVSKNDGNVSPAKAGVFLWNETGDPQQQRHFEFYNNIIDNDKGAAISYERKSEHSDFHFINNTFIVKDNFVIGHKKPDQFSGNTWIKKTE